MTRLLALCLLACSASEAGDEKPAPPPAEARDPYVRVPSVGVRLVPPEGFEPADGFDGFQQAGTQSSILAVLLPAPVAEARAGFTAERMKEKGMALLGSEEVEIEGRPALLLHASQAAHGALFLKWILIVGDSTESRLVMGTFPETQKEPLSAILRRTLLGVRLDAPEDSDPGFAVRASDRLRRVKRSPGRTLAFTREGVFPVRSPDEPLFVAGRSVGEVPVGEAKPLAVRRIRQIAGTKVGAIVESTPVSIDGLPGHEIVADAVDAKSGTPLIVHQVLLVDGNAYFLLQGIVGAKSKEEFLPEFRAMARSFARKGK
jgi:hypothetical protein